MDPFATSRLAERYADLIAGGLPIGPRLPTLGGLGPAYGGIEAYGPGSDRVLAGAEEAGLGVGSRGLGPAYDLRTAGGIGRVGLGPGGVPKTLSCCDDCGNPLASPCAGAPSSAGNQMSPSIAGAQAAYQGSLETTVHQRRQAKRREGRGSTRAVASPPMAMRVLIGLLIRAAQTRGLIGKR
jgi:hypothetical protein